MAFEESLYRYETDLINAKEGLGDEYLLSAYANANRVSLSYKYLLPSLDILEENPVINLYSEKMKEWITSEQTPTEEEYEMMIKDISLIQDTLSRWEGERLKERNLLDWTEEEYRENMGEVIKQLSLYEEYPIN